MPPRIFHSDENAILGHCKQLQVTLFLRQMQSEHVKLIASLRQQVFDEYPNRLLSIIVVGPQSIVPVPQVRSAALALLADPTARSAGTALAIMGDTAMAATLRTMVSTMLLATRANDRPTKLFADLAGASEFLEKCCQGKMTATEIAAAVDYMQLAPRPAKKSSP